MAFINARVTLEGGRAELEMCQFSRTRRDLVESFNASLDSLVGGGNFGRHDVTVLRLREGIVGIGSRTSRLWKSLNL
jgi:hypothetical protein